MCVLCGQFVTRVHWSDRPVQNGSGAVPAGWSLQSRLLERSRLAQLLNGLLRYAGLSVRDWGALQFLLTDGKGRTVLVRDLGELWRWVEDLTGRPLDPLDPDFLAYLRGLRRWGAGGAGHGHE